MNRFSHLHRLMIVALLLGAFAIIPLVDAAACMIEVGTVDVPIAADGGKQPDHQTQEKGSSFAFVDGHCDHGHCHHTTSHVCATASGTAPVDRVRYDLMDFKKALSHSPDGLIRPPKA